MEHLIGDVFNLQSSISNLQFQMFGMTEKLYYNNSFLYDFVAALVERRTLPDGRTALLLDRTAFYPTSGGQSFDTGWLELEPLEGALLPKLHVVEVAEDEAGGEVLHILEAAEGLIPPCGTTRVRGFLDVERRRDHMQQHSGQHVLSAAFVELFAMPTVSFHMGEESCTIDLEAKLLTAEQLMKAERRANEIVWEDRPVTVTLVTEDEARQMGLRKIPPAGREKLRLVEVKGYDLCACGGTHVRSTGQIGNLQLRKSEKVKQGVRVEFVCGVRALEHARRDYHSLVEAGALFSSHVWDVPAQVKNTLDDAKAAAKESHRQLEEIAELTAQRMVAATPEEHGVRLISQVLDGRDMTYARLLAQKLAAAAPNVVALLGAAASQPALVFAQSAGLPHGFNMGELMKSAMTRLGSRGGGSKDLAQGGVANAAQLAETIAEARAAILAASGK